MNLVKSRAGKIGGRRSAEIRSQSPDYHEQLQRAAVLGGKVAVIKRTGIHGHSAEERHRVASLGGKVSGRMRDMASMKTYETCAKGGAAASHVRWHTARLIFNPRCVLCQKERNAPTEQNQ
jgi:hypothetical protein